MTTTTLTLTQFLLAQIEADEAAARAVILPRGLGAPGVSASLPEINAQHWDARMNEKGRWVVEGVDHEETVAELRIAFPLGQESYSARHIARHDPAHVLAVCKAHKAIVERAGHDLAKYDGERIVELAEYTLRALATAYADRSGWRDEWRLS